MAVSFAPFFHLFTLCIFQWAVYLFPNCTNSLAPFFKSIQVPLWQMQKLLHNWSCHEPTEPKGALHSMKGLHRSILLQFWVLHQGESPQPYINMGRKFIEKNVSF